MILEDSLEQLMRIVPRGILLLAPTFQFGGAVASLRPRSISKQLRLLSLAADSAIRQFVPVDEYCA